MSLFLATVTKWQCDGWKRVSGSSGTQFLLNTNRLDSIRNTAGRSTLYYFDNPYDHRDAGHYMVISGHAPADLIVHMDTALNHNSITLPVYRNNDPTLATANIDVPVADITYAVADANSLTRSWVYGALKGWDFMGVLVNLTLAQILALT